MDLFNKLASQETLTQKELNQLKSMYEQRSYVNINQLVNDLYKQSTLYIEPVKGYELKTFGAMMHGLVMGSASQATSELENVTLKESAIISTSIFSLSFLIAGYFALKQNNRNKKATKLITKGTSELLKYESLNHLFQREPYTKFWAHGVNK